MDSAQSSVKQVKTEVRFINRADQQKAIFIEQIKRLSTICAGLVQQTVQIVVRFAHTI